MQRALALTLALLLACTPARAAGRRRDEPAADAAAPSAGVLTYQLCGGLFNQFSGIVDAIAIGHALGLRVLIGDMQTRYDMNATSDGKKNNGDWVCNRPRRSRATRARARPHTPKNA